ncbi:DUF317 domain-containing protein [Streptomyces verrucosisporus]|uniref:DUF317 domain-containing protein n=1 Tax=Streptomyces verrucosisporus TaxID=1695161 RepID=UPI0019CFC2FE|nr:DUF317 domain-containing protein [Streptomyces verrucosisporus]MBN3933033.1 DUF317 domain-containing protein [Streptomyces verrucosisporus]
MTAPYSGTHIRLDIHPVHPNAVTAILTGPRHHAAHALLTTHGFEPTDQHTLVLARIDHEELYWANQAAQALAADGFTTEISSWLREAIDEEWTWTNYPMPWCTREEIREVSNEAQKLYDDIRHGRLVIHAHADDGQTTVAVGTYRDSGQSVHLHGENHLRQVTDTFDSPAQALDSFERLHGDTLRPGPAPMTGTERRAAEARTTLGTPASQPEPQTETVPAYAADPGDHDAILDQFLTDHGDWEKWRTFSDDTTHALHASQTLRIERVHEAHPRETAWTIAAYNTPVSERMWHLTATGATPAPVLNTLLDRLTEEDAWETAIGGPITEKSVTAATRPLTDAGWMHTVDGRWVRWENHQGDAGVQFDAFAAQNPNTTLATWTLWAGPGIDRPTWAIHASPCTPASLLAHLTEDLAHGTGTRQPSPGAQRLRAQFTTTRPSFTPAFPRTQPIPRR